MGQFIPISSIVTKRTLGAEDDVTKLAESIRDNGQVIPVLLTHGNILIDGLRRIEAHRVLGRETIEVVVANLFKPAMAWIKRARLHGVEMRPLSPKRVWEVYDACRPLMNLSRSEMMKGTQYGTGIRVGGRREFVEAIGIDKEAYLQAISQVYKTAQEPTAKGVLAREMAQAMESGAITPYMAVTQVRLFDRQGTITGAGEQLAALRTATSALNGIAFGFSNLGPPNKELPAQDIDDVLRDLRRFRRTLQKLIHQLEKEQDSR